MDLVRYMRLLGLQVRMSLISAMQYRWEFLTQGLMQIMWMVLSGLPLWVAFRARAGGGDIEAAQIGDWGLYEALIVYGAFWLLRAVLEGVINPSLGAVVDHIRKGTLDFMLLKPADAQFLVSTARFAPWHVIDGLGALALMGFAIARHGQVGGAGPPGPLQVLAAAGVFVCGVAILYAVWVLVICAAFYVVKVDNLSYLFTSVFDFARWPRSVFRGALHVVFTYVIPLVVMTSYPADALRGQLGPWQAAWSALWAGVMLALSRRVWQRAIARYTSASS